MTKNKLDPVGPEANETAAPEFLSGGGEMGALMRAHDIANPSGRSGTPALRAGPPEVWDEI